MNGAARLIIINVQIHNIKRLCLQSSQYKESTKHLNNTLLNPHLRSPRVPFLSPPWSPVEVPITCEDPLEVSIEVPIESRLQHSALQQANGDCRLTHVTHRQVTQANALFVSPIRSHLNSCAVLSLFPCVDDVNWYIPWYFSTTCQQQSTGRPSRRRTLKSCQMATA